MSPRPAAASPQSQRFAVFLSHNSRDKPVVRRIAEKVRALGLDPWFDAWCVTPGRAWMQELAAGLENSESCAVFIGPHGISDWEDQEQQLAMARVARDRSFRLFLVLLPGLPEPFDDSALPPFLTLRTWVDLRKGLGDSRAFQTLVNAIKGVPLGAGEIPPASPGVNPYRGLRTFEAEHARFFFGRDADIQRLVEKLRTSRFLAVLGASGTGKSSLVRAGLIPALTGGAIEGSAEWPVRMFAPSAQPVTALAAQMLRLFPGASMQQTLDQLTQDERTLQLAVTLGLAEHPEWQRLVFVVDQFEEIFTLCADDRERAAFLANLLYAAFVPNGRTVVVLTLRADFYHKCAAHAELSSRIATHQVLVGPLSESGLRQAVEEPARLVGLDFESGLVETILLDVAHQSGALPLLEHALFELGRRARGRMLTLEAYRESGGVSGAVAARADAVYAGFTESERAIARRVMLRLTQPGEGTDDTRRRAYMSELVTRDAEADGVAAVVRAFADARLLRTDSGERAADPVVDVAHEALIRSWPLLRQWVDEVRDDLRLHRRLSDAAREWDELGRDQGALLRGVRLAEIVDAPHLGESGFNELERSFVQESIALRERERAEREERRQREILHVQELESALARTEEQRKIARSRELAAVALSQIAIDPELSVLLAREAVTTMATSQAEAALRYALLESHLRLVVNGSNRLRRDVFNQDGSLVVSIDPEGRIQVWKIESGEIVVQTESSSEPARQVIFSPDGALILSAAARGPAHLWESATLQLRWSGGGSDWLRSIAFSPDGKLFATSGGNDHTVYLWETRTGRCRKEIKDLGALSMDVAFSPDGKLLAGCAGNEAHLYTVARPRRVAVIDGGGQYVNQAGFSPDGEKLVVAGGSDDVRLWNVSDNKLTAVLRGHTDLIEAAVFSPDSQSLVTASWDGTARIWDAEGNQALELRGHSERLYSADFRPDGSAVATGGQDGTVRVSDSKSGRTLAILRGHKGSVDSVVFSPGGDCVVTTGHDDTIRVWQWSSLRPTAVVKQAKKISSGAVSADGALIVTADEDGHAYVWDGATGERVGALDGHRGAIDWIVFFPDGNSVLTCSEDKTLRVWEPTTGRCRITLKVRGKELRWPRIGGDGRWFSAIKGDDEVCIWSHEGALIATLAGHDGDVTGVDVSPDGTTAVTACWDRTARLFDLQSLQQRGVLEGHRKAVFDARFSPDGGRIVTASRDGSARVWSASTGECLTTLPGGKKYLNAAMFSPDGTQILTASRDHLARVWDAASGRLLVEMRGHTSEVRSARFVADGHFVFTVSHDQTARVWEAATGRQLIELRHYSGVAHEPAAEDTDDEDDDYFNARVSHDGTRVLMWSGGNRGLVYTCEECGRVPALLELAGRRLTRTLTDEERGRFLV